MEEFVKIPLDDGKNIYGVWQGADEDKLIIFVHGITGNMHEHQYFLAPAYFNPERFDTFRFNFYSSAGDARKLHECSVTQHVADLYAVIEHYSDKKIYLVAHSLGALVALKINHEAIQKKVLLDPTKGIQSLEQKHISQEDEKYIWQKSMNIEVGKQMIEEWTKAAEITPYSDLVTDQDLFVFAGKEKNKEAWRPHISEYKIVENATHCFVEEGTLDEAYQHMLAHFSD